MNLIGGTAREAVEAPGCEAHGWGVLEHASLTGFCTNGLRSLPACFQKVTGAADELALLGARA